MNKRQIAILLGVFLATIFAVTNAVLTLSWLQSSSDPGWSEGHDRSRLRILRVRNPSQIQLQPGDEIIQLNGRPVSPTFSTYRAFERVPPFTPYTVQIKRNSELYELSLQTAEFPLLFTIGIVLAVIVVPFSFLIPGLAVFLFSQGEKKILLLAAALILTIPEVPLFSITDAPLWAKLIMIVGRSVSYLAFPLYLNFLLTFPDRSPLLRRFPSLNHGIRLYLPYFVTGLLGSLYLSFLSIQSPEQSFFFRGSFFGYLYRYGTILFYVPVMLLVVFWAGRTANPAVRRRVKIVTAGLCVGFSFTLLRILFLVLVRFMPFDLQARVPFTVLDTLVVLAFGTLACMPPFFIYAVARRQLIPINIAIRRVAEYSLTYFGFALAFFLLTALMSYLLVTLLTYLDIPIVWTATLFVPPLTILSWTAFAVLNKQVLKPRINRRSTRVSYDLREAITDAVSQIGNLIKIARVRLPIASVDQGTLDSIRAALKETLDTEEIASIVCRRIQETWIIKDVAILLEDGVSGAYLCSAHKSLGSIQMTRTEMAKLALAREARVVRELQATQNLLFDPGSWVGALPESEFVDKHAYLAELQIIRKLRPAILMPIRVEDQMVGILSLGSRAEAWTYNMQDRQTLLEVARETGEAIALARLKMIAGSIDLALVLENVISATAVPAQKGSIYLWNEEEQLLIFSAHFGYSDDKLKSIRLKRGEGFAGRAFELKEPFVVDDAQSDRRGVDAGSYQVKEIQSSVFVPLVALGRAIGVLCLDNLETKAAFKKQHLDKLIRVTAVASIVVQNAIMIDEQRNLVARINTGELSINDIFGMVFNSVRRVTDVRASHLVLLLDPYMPDLCVEQEPLLCLAQGLSGKDKFKLALSRQSELGYRTLLENKPVSGDSLEDWQPLVEGLDIEGTKSCICLPLPISTFVGGLLYLHYCSEHEFSDPEIITLKFFAEQAAVAISNARQRDELSYTNKVVWMSLMMSNIRHEIRQYSEAISTTLDVLNNRLIGQDETRHILAMKRSLGKIMELQQQSLPSPSDNVKEVVEFNKFLNTQVRRWCDQDHLTIHLKSDCYVSIDQKQFRLVLKNLITNAVRAMKMVEQKHLTVSSEIIGQRLMVRVSNTGLPIPITLQHSLFTDVIYGNPNSSQRTGIGLFIGRRIVRYHEGDLHLVKSDENETTFAFWLPVVEARSPRIAKERIGNGTIQNFSG